jgi:magnesium transporter
MREQLSRIVRRKDKSETGIRTVFDSPGAGKYVGKINPDSPEIRWVKYHANGLEIVQHLEALPDFKAEDFNNWIDINGLHDETLVQEIGHLYGFHQLMIEDILNTLQKPKLDIYDQTRQLLLSLKIPYIDTKEDSIQIEHAALVLSSDWVITFQEKDAFDAFYKVTERLKRTNSKTKKSDLDYLFFVLVDLIIDTYFVCIDYLNDKIDALSDKVLVQSNQKLQNEIYFIRKEILMLKKAISPLKEIMTELIRDEEEFFSKETKVYMRDVFEHVKDLLGNIEAFREELESINANYLANMSNKMNQVMKTLTVFTAIFMPLTFIAGIYGMNFENMPELRHPEGYFYALGGMALMALILYIYFKVKKYI